MLWTDQLLPQCVTTFFMVLWRQSSFAKTLMHRLYWATYILQLHANLTMSGCTGSALTACSSRPMQRKEKLPT